LQCEEFGFVGVGIASVVVAAAVAGNIAVVVESIAVVVPAAVAATLVELVEAEI